MSAFASYEQFESYIKKQIQFLLEEPIQFQTITEDPMTLMMVFSDGRSEHLYLGNVWKEHLSTKTLDGVERFSKLVVRASKPHVQYEKGIQKECLLPILKTENFLNIPLPESEIVYTSLLPGFVQVLAQDFEEYVQYVLRKEVPVGENSEHLFEIAHQNLQKKSWVEPGNIITVPQGTFLLYMESKFPFHLQFFHREKTKKMIGEYFLLAVPAHDFAFVFVPKEPELLLHFEPLSAMTSLAQDAFRKEPHAVSPSILVFESQNFYTL